MTVPGVTPLPENHATPSCTRSKRSWYWPPCGGAVTCACSVTDWPGFRSAGSFVRAPSHTTEAPAVLYQWYARFTGYELVVGNTPSPVLVIVTGTVAVWPAPNAGAA